MLLLVVLMLGTQQVTAQTTYYVFKYNNHYLAHNGYTTNGSEIVAEETFSAEKCLWERVDNDENNASDKILLKTYGADYYLAYDGVNTDNYYTLRLMTKNVAQYAKDRWNKINTNNGPVKYMQSPHETGYKEHYIYYDDFTDEGTTTWRLIHKDQTHSQQVSTTTVTVTDYPDVNIALTPQTTEISAIGTYTNTAIVSTNEAYQTMSFGGDTYYYYSGSTHNTAPTVTVVNAPALTWSLTDNDYATIDPSTGTITVSQLPTQNVTMTLTCTYGSDSESVEITLGPEMIEVSSLSEITDANGRYRLTSSFSTTGTATDGISGKTIGTSSNPFTGTIDGGLETITGTWDKPLFDFVQNATIKNVIVGSVNISQAGKVGAIAGTANGTTRIYNCGLQGGTVQSTGSSTDANSNDCCGGLVGFLNGEARVVNCYSYANITGGNRVGGIVGYNNVKTTSTNLKTMVFGCMFYGDITGGTNKAPIYNGQIITNRGDSKGVSNYNYFRAEASYVQNRKIDTYNCSLLAETRFLQRFEFFRHLLNGHRELSAWWVTGSSADKDKIMKWVMEPSQIDTATPYPILKQPGRYPSVVNYQIDGGTCTAERRGTLTVNIRMANGNQFNAPAGAAIKTSQLSLNITDKDPDHFNFNYYKVQLPYYNDVGTENYTGNRVVTGWKIVSVTGGTQGTFTKGTDATTDAAGNITAAPYNFADRNSYAKDLYSESGRIFNQGAYWDVPKEVTAITIEPYWAKAAYLSDSYADVIYNQNMGTSYDVPSVGGGQIYTNGNSYDINGDSQEVYTSMSNAVTALGINTSHTVYDYAVVLVGNYHLYYGSAVAMGGSNPYTVTSIDADHDNEPDYSYILRFDGRCQMHPVRVDFLNIPGLGMAQKSTGGKGTYNFGIMQPIGWFESTNTSLFRVTQFEYDRSTRGAAPLILQGGVMEQWVNGQSGGAANKTTYFHVGGNVWFKEFHRGTHIDNTLTSKHPPLSVTGGDYDQFYLTGLYKAVTSTNDNAECYINGGRFGIVAGTGIEGIGNPTNHENGNIVWQIQNADITEFYGGGCNAEKIAEGNITTVISDSRVGTFCGGPKFGDMNANRKVFTTATNCTFGTFFGAGYGGNSYSTYPPQNATPSADYGESNWNTFVTNNYKQEYQSQTNYKGVSTEYYYQYLPHSNNTGQVARIFINFVIFSMATTHDVTSKLTGCTVTGNFYGGGSLGKVNGPVTSTLTDCTVQGSVYGAGFSASLPTVEVMNTGGFVKAPFYDENLGAYFAPEYPATVTYKWEHAGTVNSTETAIDKTNHILYTTEDLTTLGTVTGDATLTLNGTTSVGGNVFGGGEESAAGSGTIVNVQDNATVMGSVYGGGNKGNVAGGTQVNLTGGTVTKDVYGGGRGVLEVKDEYGNVTTAAVAATVGSTTVELNKDVDDAAKGCVIGGSIFGCNNLNGTPLGTVTVHVYKTQNVAATRITNPTEGEQTAKVAGRYDVHAVYGGGNHAAYEPTTPWNGATGSKSSVTINGCDATSIEYVFGGGNAAPVPEANVTVNGCYEIGWLFGGGNGAGDGNPGANVGIIDAAAYDNSAADGVPLGSRAGLYGTGNATTNIYGGTVGHLFGGSNAHGNITGMAALTLNETEDDDGNPLCPISVTNELFGFGNAASMDGEGQISVGCVSGTIAALYGGAKAADVGGNIDLHINSGTFGYVFGGNESSGTIHGTVTVTVEESGCKPIVISEIYGGGNLAPYTAPAATPGYPQINIVSCTSIGTIYGGGYGNTAIITGNPQVNVNMEKGAHASLIGNQLGAIGTVFGGGNAAAVEGSTTVSIGTAEGKGANISGNVFGGGNQADVTGQANVVVGRK